MASILNSLISSIVPFTILLGILIFVHELGHFLVARWCGVRVEVFSLGFGKKILSFKRGDTTYCISLIPLGGYVKMFGEQNGDVVSTEERAVSFTHKNVWQRIAIVSAGPLMNFIFAVFVFGFIAQIGETTRSAVIAEVTEGSAAEKMGLAAGDKILKANGQNIRSYEEFQKVLNQFKGQSVSVEAESESKSTKTLDIKVVTVPNPNIFSIETEIGSIDGLLPYAKGTSVAVISGTPADKLGFKTGDRLLAIGTTEITRWDHIQRELTKASTTDFEKLVVKVEREVSEKEKPQTLEVTIPHSEKSALASMATLGFEYPDLYLDQVVPGSPADKAGLKRHDRLYSINGTKLDKWEQVLNTIKSFNGEKPLVVEVKRGNETLPLEVMPQITSQMNAVGQEDKRYTIGIWPLISYAQSEMTTVKADNIFQAANKGLARTWDISAMTVFSFVKLFQGEVSHKNIGGMISIGKAAKDSYEMGLQAFLMTMGILSVSLFILNLLPIPVLDGGHLVFYFIEVVKGSPLSLKKMEIAQQIGFVLLIGLMILSIFNDVTKFLFTS